MQVDADLRIFTRYQYVGIGSSFTIFVNLNRVSTQWYAVARIFRTRYVTKQFW